MSEVTGQVLAAPAGWPDPPDPAAWRGMAGAIAEAVAPHTEADPVAVLAQLLVGAGAIIGREAWLQIEAFVDADPERTYVR